MSFSPILSLPAGDSNGELLARFCGQTIPTLPIVVFTPELYVHFQTDISEGDLGFKAKYFFSGKSLSLSCLSFVLSLWLLGLFQMGAAPE